MSRRLDGVYNARMQALLDRARTGSPEARLAALVEAWRATRAPAIADAIERLDARVLARHPIVGAADRGAKQLWRRARQGDAVAIGHVLADLVPKRLAPYERDPFEATTLEALVRLPDDPRLARTLCALGFATSGVLAKLAAIRDTRAIDWLADARDVLGDVRAPRVDRATKAAVAALAVDATEDALLREVYARPRSDEPRLIYADHRLAQADPRGELIALQCAPSLDARGKRRLADLLARYAPRWIGPVEPYLVTAGRAKRELRRGFLARCRINGANPGFDRTHGEVAARLATHRAWATLEVVEIPRHSVKWNRPLVAHLEKLRVEVKLLA
jgi:uncharacterized protein (TIGR02996 family)